MSSQDRLTESARAPQFGRICMGLPDGASSRYAVLRHEVARATAILPRNELHIRYNSSYAAAGPLA